MRKIIYSIGLLLLLSGCGFLDEYSQDLVTPKTVYELDEILLGNGYLPRKEVSELRNGGLAWWLSILDDDINTVTEQAAVIGFSEMDRFYYGYTAWQLEVGRNYKGGDVRDDSYEWEELYRRINAMNLILYEIDDMPQDAEKDRLAALRIKGECHFLRAQYYFLLVNIYGSIYQKGTSNIELGVPLKLTHYVEHDNKKESQFERASVGDVYDQIVLDLKSSITFLNESGQKKSHRVPKEAAQLLLSRVYLYMQDWGNAEALSKEVIDNNPSLMHYGTIGGESSILNTDNPEIIFSQGTLNLQNVFTARGGDFCISSDLYDLYTEDDYRKDLFFHREIMSDSIALHRKYKKGLHISSISDLYTLRTSEAYLNLMEAKSMLKKESEARDLLNVFRGFRMKNVPSDVYSSDELIKEIRDERRKELCLEGHRWFDLRRYSKNSIHPFKKEIFRSYSVYDWDNRNIHIKTDIYKLGKDDDAYTFSIPKSVLEFDRGLINNPRTSRKPVEVISSKK